MRSRSPQEGKRALKPHCVREETYFDKVARLSVQLISECQLLVCPGEELVTLVVQDLSL